MKNKLIAVLTTAWLLFCTLALHAQTKRYVMPAASGSGNGSSWANASADLQLMIDISAAGDSIFVASGIYRPTRAANNTSIINAANRDNAFVLKANVKIYGGFAGTEATLAQRVLNASTPSVLSGEIGSFATTADNTYHVVIGVEGLFLNNQPVLDGFTITGGNANGAGNLTVGAASIVRNFGGGIYLVTSSPLIANCRFLQNVAGDRGGAIFDIASAPLINNCIFEDNNGTANGGGIFSDASFPVLTSCSFIANRAQFGAAVYNFNNSSATLTDCGFLNHINAFYGGAMYNNVSESFLTRCTFTGNTAHWGGAIFYNNAQGQLISCTFTNNSAGEYGGAVYNYLNSDPLIQHTTFTTNTAVSAGGAMYNETAAGPTISNSSFTGNSAQSGGAIWNMGAATLNACQFRGNTAIGGGAAVYNSDANPSFYNCLFSGNATTGVGGGGAGMYNTSSSPTVINCTFSGNRDSDNGFTAGGMFNFNNSVPIIRNSIFWGNSSQITLFNSAAPTSNNNIIQGGGFGASIGNPLFKNAPGFAAAPFTGGDYSLNDFSAAINTGNNGYMPYTEDLAGNTRIYAGTVDIGAYEYYHGIPSTGNIMYVDANVVGGTGLGDSWANAMPHVADALRYAKENENAWSAAVPLKIFVAKGTYKPKYHPHNYSVVDPNARTNTYLMVNHVQLYGGFDPANGIDDLSDARIFGAAGSILNGDVGVAGNSSDNVYHVLMSIGNVGTAVLDGFTVTKGNANNSGLMTVNGQSLEIISGGGMLLHSSSPQVLNCSFIGNECYSDNARPSHGAGLGIELNSNPVITNCKFNQNAASGYGYGGGIGTYDNSAPVIINCAFNTNTTAANGGGAAISIRGGAATIKGCVIYGNFAGYAGGGLLLDGSPQVSLISCTINDNHAPGNRGGGIYLGFQTWVPATMLNNILFGNPGGDIISSTNFPVPLPWTNINYDPLFINATGGAGVGPDGILGTGDDGLRLQQASPAINAGTDTIGLNLLPVDITGANRVQKSRIDLGAYEMPYVNCNTYNGILYVDSTVGISGDGSTWTTAFQSLSEALATAGRCTNINSIYVAKGTYYPDSLAGNGSTNKDRSFVLVPNVKIYGGFPAGGGTLAQRVLPSATTPGNTILSGDIDKNDVISNGITSSFNGSNALHVIVAAGNTGTAELDGFTVTGGNADDGSGTTITVNGQTLEKNNGGGMYNMASSLIIKNCSFEGNRSFIAGSGIYNESSSPAISDCFFRKNSTGNWGAGMANYAGSNGTILRCRFEDNTASQAAGMANYNSSPTITDCIFSGNTFLEYGGAMLNLTSSPAIRNCLFTGNRGTSALASGGAMFNTDNSSPLIFNCTFAGNYVPDATLGGAIWNEFNSVPVIRNTIIYGNSSGMQKEASNPVATVSNSIVQGGHPGAADADPLFINSPAAATAPFTTGDYRLLNAGSFAVNSGTPNISGLNLPATDIAGLPRVQGGRIDMGAHESAFTSCPAVLYVDSSMSISGNGASWATAFKTLEEAFVFSKQCGITDSILVAKGTYYPDSIPGYLPSGVTARDRAFRLLPNVKMIGGYPTGGGSFAQRVLPTATGAGNTILSGDIDKNDLVTNGITSTFNGNNAYHVVISVGPAGSAVFDGFTLTGGSSQDVSTGGLIVTGLPWNMGGMPVQNGNGMYILNSSVVIRNCSFSGNGSNFGSGAGLCNQLSTPDIRDCFFMKNRSEMGTGTGMANLECSSGTILRCRFEDNVAPYGTGVGMANQASSLTITDCIFSGNTGGWYGIGMYNSSATPVITNCVFTGNRGTTNSETLGAGMANYLASPTIINCTFAGNWVWDPAYGGAIWNEQSSAPVIRNSIIYNNSSGIVTDNMTPAGPAIVSNSIVQGGHTGAIDVNPQFFHSPLPAAAPFTNGDYRLQNCSPAINAGDNAVVPGAVLTDVATQPRIQLGTVDMGAHESIANATTAGLAVNDTVITRLQSNNSPTLYTTHCNTLVASVTGDGTPTSITGNTVTKLWIEDVQPVNFVKRHYEITPQTGAATATASITLYFTQAEFDDFNAVNLLKLPQGPADATGKANLMIEKIAGTSNNNTGLPESYTGSIMNINPDDANIVWNAAASRWEVSFTVTGFSGFFVKTQLGTLPLRLLSFTAKEDNCTSTLEWVTAEENEVSHFEVEQSTNGIAYTAIKTVTATNSGIQHTYRVSLPVADNKTYYRLKMVDNDGKIKYSDVKLVTADCATKIVVYPNPATDRLFMKNATPGSNYFLYDNNGKLVISGRIANSTQEIVIAGIASGVYYISLPDETGNNKRVKFIKE
jgi:hypothetical protein